MRRVINKGVKTCGKPSYSGYNRGCRCMACSLAKSIYLDEWRHGKSCRATPEETDKARRKVRKWSEQGFSQRRIAAVTGVRRPTIKGLLDGTRKRIGTDNYEAIMECGIKNGDLVIRYPSKY